ncbi:MULTISPECIES: RusA family crossover junction endodeoxyribonuclease [unclassified Pantoea]|uniref:RusA family crossover junction endodeoxyribonuclease n=1 Tax=unclassified Pantoea TaxID=2630326 RepID=UPI001CD4A6F1|nr:MULTISPECIES: RusA family crossover junction endodeoxyribonuclease [unclassified Pantoea]MCA1178888.1 RusA family crossover junction endodeoxyribonuclease [Pantoea sp. alder69]MCA1253799.1 RusA family crossover junction endodeoxyribonuclease [Pantoea sp. alder70]MCA1267377.1 RusA family crossover junction endodeoxyribonuclease [Pantoea sp. alder81]
MNEYRITLPWPPGNNHLFSVFRGRKIKSKKGREYTSAVTQQITESNQQYQLAGRLKVKILAYPPTRARRDLDNLFKAPLDSLTHAGVIADDSLIDDVRMVRCEVVKGGRLEIIITEMEQAA